MDNSGSDVVLGVLPFARELLRRGTKVRFMPQHMPGCIGNISDSCSSFLVLATLSHAYQSDTYL